MARPTTLRWRRRQRQRPAAGMLVLAAGVAVAAASASAAAVAARLSTIGRVGPLRAAALGVGVPLSRLLSSVGDLPTLSRVTIERDSACGPSRAIATATCPCYYSWVTVAGEPTTSFDITLSLAEKQPRRLSAREAAAVAAMLREGSSYGVKGSYLYEPGNVPERYVSSSQAIRIDANVAVTLSVASRGKTGTNVPGREGGCDAMVHYVLEPVEARCAARDINVGGKGEMLDGEFRASTDHPGAVRRMRRSHRVLQWKEEPAIGRGRRSTSTTGSEGRGVIGIRRRDSGRWGAADKAPTFLPPPSSRIVGGSPIRDPAARHFVVRIAIANGICTGSLITRRHVLTAAHCRVTVGDQVLWPSPQVGRPPVATRRVSAVTVHPEWAAAGYVHDLAILTLGSAARAWDGGVDRDDDPSVAPLVVAHDAGLPADGSGVRTAGYGRISLGWVVAPQGLSVDLRTVSVPDCKADWIAAPPERNSGGGVDSGRGEGDALEARMELAASLHPAAHVCAGIEAGGCDTCSGDSGGPLYQRVPATDTTKPYYVLVGVTSFSPGCASPNTPTAYARVASYAGWIDMVVGGDGTGPLLADGSRIGGPNDTTTYPMSPDLDSPAREGARGGGRGGGAALWGSLGSVAVAAVVVAAGVLLVRQRRRRRAADAVEAASAADHRSGRSGEDARGALPAVAWEPPTVAVAAAGTPPPPAAPLTVISRGSPSPPPGEEGTPGGPPTVEAR
ncbi:hypothetical protein MMPV_002026 [Pyropia vietnamensis]